jgi:hypothetical protein
MLHFSFLYLQKKRYQKGKMRTQVVLGPQPGTVLDQGTHRVVVKVAYQLDSDNNITDRSLAPRHHAYCRYTLQVMPSSLAAGNIKTRKSFVRTTVHRPSFLGCCFLLGKNENKSDDCLMLWPYYYMFDDLKRVSRGGES